MTLPSRPTDSSSPTLARLAYLADVVAVYHRHGGLDAAVAVAKERSGTAFDPSLVDLFCSHAKLLLSDLDAASSWDTVIAAEPQLELLVSEERFDDALERSVLTRGADPAGDRGGPPAPLT